MISEKIENLKIGYTNKENGTDIGRDFIAPCLAECVHYRRNVGYFFSSSFLTWIGEINNIINNDVKIQLMCHPQLDKTTKGALENILDEKERIKFIDNQIEKDFLLSTAKIKEKGGGLGQNWQSRLVCYLIANEILEIRFNIPLKYSTPRPKISKESRSLSDLKQEMQSSDMEISDEDSNDLYHVKIGWFDFKDGDEIAFHGSANESHKGMRENIDNVAVYKNWKGEAIKEYFDLYKSTLEKHWENNEETQKSLGFRTMHLTKEALEQVKVASPKSRPTPDLPVIPPIIPNKKNKYRHQEEAVDKFLKLKKGVLEMATGTGKTRTACKIINELFKKNQIEQFIVTLEGKDLLLQWYDIFQDEREVESQKLYNYGVNTFKDKAGSKVMRDRFILNPKNSGLVISVNDVHNVLAEFNQDTLSKTLLIFDEVHDIGTELKLGKLTSLTKDTGYCLGLSATPSKGEHKEEMTKGIFDAIGGGEKPIYTFSLEDAIKREILCEFKYNTIEYALSEEDHEELKKKYKMLGGGVVDGVRYTSADVAMQIARIYKKTKTKLEPFENFLDQNQDLLKSTIIFVENKKYGYEVCKILHKYSKNYNIYFDETKREVLTEFTKNEIDILVTCEAISQGIDIPSLKNIVLFSANKEKKQTIQRLGRCLRNPSNETNDKKVARVIDFWQIRDDDKPSYDQERVDWLQALSETKGEENA